MAWYKKYEGIDIWKENIDPDIKMEADYIIAHSLGAIFVLANWQNNGNTVLILVNPLLLKRSFFAWIYRWLRLFADEGCKIDKNVSIFRIFYGLKKFYQLSKNDAMRVLKEMPRDRLVILRGCKDRFFCDNKTKKLIEKNNIKIIEVEEAGHHWHKKFDDIIEGIIG